MKNETLNNSLHKSFTLNIKSREGEIKWPNESSSVSSGFICQLKDINNSSEQLSHGTKKTPTFHNCQMGFDRVALPSDLFIAKNCEYNSEMDFINKVVTQPLDFISEFNANFREKCSITIKNDYILNLIRSILQDSTFDWRVTNEFDLIFRHADASPDVRNAKSSEEINIKLLFKTIQITYQCIDNNEYGHVKYKSFESFSDILKKLWDIANNLPDAYSKQAVKKFKEIYSHMSTTMKPHNSSDASHRSTAPTLIAEPRIIDNTMGNDTSVGIGVVVGGRIIGAGAAGCTSCVKGGANAGSVTNGVGGRSSINTDKITERIHSREWNIIPSRDSNPPKFEPEKNEIPQMWPYTDTQGGGGSEVEVKVEVKVGGMESVTNSTTILFTRGLSDCSALIVLSDWNGVSYGSRTLVHLNGSNVSYGLKYCADASGLISELRKTIIGGGKVILVGGTLGQSNIGLGITIGQNNNSGEKPLYELMSTPGISLDISGSSQVYVYPDGTFKLGDIEGERGVLTKEEVNNILSYAID